MTSADPHRVPAGKNPSVRSTEAGTRPVRDVMIRTPKTLPSTATAADARALFSNPKVLSVPLVDGAEFAGLLDREDLPAAAPDAAPVRDFARHGAPTITARRPVQEAVELMAAAGAVRLVVLAEDGTTLRGLLALDHARTGFCRGS